MGPLRLYLGSLTRGALTQWAWVPTPPCGTENAPTRPSVGMRRTPGVWLWQQTHAARSRTHRARQNARGGWATCLYSHVKRGWDVAQRPSHAGV